MSRKPLPALFLLAGLAALAADAKPKSVPKAEQPSAAETQWVWLNEGDPAVAAPAETRYFRRVFAINRPVPNPIDEAQLDITADNAYTVWVNGVEVGKGDNWQTVQHYEVKKLLTDGKNVVAVEARNADGPAGLMVRLGYTPNGQSKLALCTDASWKASKTAGEGWQRLDFDDRAWQPVKELGPYGTTPPWNQVAAAGNPRFTVPDGFRVEMAVRNPDPNDVFSLVNMTFDDRGRLLVSQENGPVLLCTEPDKAGVLQNVRPYCSIVKNCQGMCWVGDALLLVGQGPEGVGLYRCRDAKGKDEIDEAKLIFPYAKVMVPGYGEHGGMGEHGPHAVLHGPDGFLYVVNGNHSWADVKRLAPNSPLTRWPHGQMGPDQGQPGSTEDVLLPRLNDANGHATNILAPGGCIWRLDPDGSNPALVACGFRNEFDAALRLDGELFTFDSDMEWDEGLPWYRPVRVCHCPPGADFVWRTGSANTPPYYIDSLPATRDVGRGSPVGLEFYEHTAFPPKYRGAYLMADWSLGVIYAAHLKPAGASYALDLEKFCTGAPMNVTDVGVAPDGSVYFTMGGRHTQGGVYRIVYDGGDKKAAADKSDLDTLLAWPQPQAAWSRAALDRWVKEKKVDLARVLGPAAEDATLPAAARVKALTLLQMHGKPPDDRRLAQLLGDALPEVRAQAVYLIGVNDAKAALPFVVPLLRDDDAFVRRRACEALLRCGAVPPLPALWPLLGDPDRFVRTAGRLCLQKMPAKEWTKRLWAEENDLIFDEAVVALCKTDQAAPYEEQIFDHLHKGIPEDAESQLQYIRTLQLALLHTSPDKRPGSVRGIALECADLFPTKDWRVGRELALLLASFRRDGTLGAEDGATAKVVQALLDAKGDRRQQMHYFYCLRFLPDLTPAEKKALAEWYEGTRDWKGGNSFNGFLANIFKDVLAAYDVADRKALLASGEKTPHVVAALARRLQEDRQAELLPALVALAAKLPPEGEAQTAVDDALAETALTHPADDDFAYLIQALNTTNTVELFKVVLALKKAAAKPKADEPAAWRAALRAAGRLGAADRWKVVELLRHWTNGRQFGADEGDWRKELGSWSRWFNQTFPKEPPLPDVAGDAPVVSKYKYDELLAFLTAQEGKVGDAARGKDVFTKAQCIKCHKFGQSGEGIGPDLTNVSKRFKRPDILESICYPSKVISDQYRSTQFVTKQGQTVVGLASLQGDVYTVLQKDGTKLTLKKDEVDQQFTSLISVMPEGLLDPLEKKEIADLFAYLESQPGT